MSEADPSDSSFQCAYCGATIPRSDDPMLQCPACRELLITAGNTLEYESQPDELHVPSTDEDELSHLRIMQISTLRRTAARSRSYFIIGAGFCLIAAIELGMRVASELHRRDQLMQRNSIALQSLAALAAIWGLWHFTRRIIAMTRELSQSMLDEPTRLPDFSTLSDGSQPIRDLEEMHKITDDQQRTTDH